MCVHQFRCFGYLLIEPVLLLRQVRRAHTFIVRALKAQGATAVRGAVEADVGAEDVDLEEALERQRKL